MFKNSKLVSCSGQAWHRSEYNQAVKSGQLQRGGDFWNTDKLVVAVFSDNDVISMKVPTITTGAWADVQIYSQDHGKIERRYFA